jgi:hypothetical protein
MKTIAALALSLLLLPAWAMPQQVGASVTGHVNDASGGAVAGATVTAKLTNTGAVYTAATDSTGLYQLPFMNAGPYTFTIEKQGFQTLVRSGVTLEVAQKAVMDFTLQVGAVSQRINVSANAAMVQAESGEQTWTIDSQLMANVPLRGENYLETLKFAPGVTLTGSAESLTPFDTSGSQQMDIGGGLSGEGATKGGTIGQPGCCGNLDLVDGISTNGEASGVHYIPPNDAVEEVNAQDTMYDTEYGWSTGGVIEAVTKSGTNQIHGDAYEYFQDTPLDANNFEDNADHIPISPWHFNVYGASAGAPILKNKFFLYFSWQQIKRDQPCPFTDSVPTAAEKNGDFSQTLNSSGTLQTLYDPLTTTETASGVYTRTAFPGNIIPADRMSEVAEKVLAYIPPPNAPGAEYTGLGNFVNPPDQRRFLDTLPEFSGRADWNLSDKTHASFYYGWNQLSETRSYVYSTISAFNEADTGTNSPFSRANDFFSLQVTHTFNPTTVLEARAGMERFGTGGGSTISNGFNLASLGFSPEFVSEGLPHFPIFQWSDYDGAGATLESFCAQPTYEANAVLDKTYNQHNVKFGFEMMDILENDENPGNASGTFDFTGVFTTANFLAQTAATGNSVADFLLGDPATGSIQVEGYPALTSHLYALFGQDDIHVSRRLTLTAGLRWDYQGPLTDRFNALATGFCTTCASPLQIPAMPLYGGLEFAGVGGNPRGTPNPHYANFGPRLSFAYEVRPNTVVRGGYGMMYSNYFDFPGQPAGFSQTTSLVSTVQPGIPNPNISLENPFPTGKLLPVGSSEGLASGLGESIAFPDSNMNMPRVQQFSLALQHQFGRNWLASVSYIGNYISRLPVTRQLNYLSLQDLGLASSKATYPSASQVSYLTQSVPNPFLAASSNTADEPYLGELTGTYLANSTLEEEQLLVPYPQFSMSESTTSGGVLEDYVPVGKSSYNGLTLDMNKRMSEGLDFDANFTWSKAMLADEYINPTDPAPAWFISPYDCPFQFKLSAYWELPVGPGMRFLSHTSPVASRLIGGWFTSADFMWMDGFPIAAPSGVEPTGAPESTPNQSIGHWFNTCTLSLTGVTSDCSSGQQAAWKTLEPDQLTTWSPYISQLRSAETGDLELNVGKITQFNERYALKIYADFINATNTTEWLFDGPQTSSTSGQFGEYFPFTGQSNYARIIELVAKFSF